MGVHKGKEVFDIAHINDILFRGFAALKLLSYIFICFQLSALFVAGGSHFRGNDTIIFRVVLAPTFTVVPVKTGTPRYEEKPA